MPLGWGATAGSGSIDACALLALKEVSAAGDYELDLALPQADDKFAYCQYSFKRGHIVNVFVSKSVEAATAYFSTVKAGKGKVVSGVGDQAYWSTDYSFYTGLYFLKGGVLAHISGSPLGPEERIITLGKLLAGRI